MSLRSIEACLTVFVGLISLLACFPVTGGVTGSQTTSARQITFSGPITVRILSGDSFPGTNIKYMGKTNDDRANVTIGGLAAPKKSGDSLNWSGAPLPFSLVNLQTRVVSFDDSSLVLVGKVDIIVQTPQPTPGQGESDYIMEFTLPATFNLGRSQTVQGTTLAYVGKKTEGAQFSGIDGYPYRQSLDSIIWTGHLREKIFVKADLRVAFYNDTSANLVGTMVIRFEQ